MQHFSPKLKKCLMCQEDLPNPKNQNLLYFSKKVYQYVFPKTHSDNSFHLFYKLNETLLLVFKNIESFLLC